ncbi:MAG: cohesin domain-containing protein [Geobacteraceae bacterium]|nr:cohesin domain-containing protein [Geobacteraceae bacterium]
MKKSAFLLFLMLTLVLGLVHGAQAAPTLTVSPKGAGSYALQGSGFQNVGTIFATVTYDASRLATPKVQQGSLISGTLMAVNDKTPGTITIGVVSASPINGSGPVATMGFTVKGGGGASPSVRVSFTDTNGTPLEGKAASAPTNSGGSTSEPAASSTGGSEATTAPSQQPAAATGGQTWLGGVTMPQEETGTESKAETVPVQSEPPPVERPSLPEAVNPSPPATGPKGEGNPATGYIAVKEPLERFREFTGERTPGRLIALLAPEGSGKFVQEPAVAFSDGKKAVRITVEAPGSVKSPPQFILNGATLGSLRKGKGNTWVLRARPKGGVCRASLDIVNDGSMVEFPLTVAPSVKADLDGKGGVMEADFQLFLKERGTADAPRFDLNGDGKRDYIDDYIFTANYIVKKKGAKKK